MNLYPEAYVLPCHNIQKKPAPCKGGSLFAYKATKSKTDIFSLTSTFSTMKKNLETLCIHGGWKAKKGEPQQLPIYQSTTFKYETSEQMARLFDLEDEGYFYTRLANPYFTCV